MDSDQELKQGVERELEWDPKVDAANVRVVVKDLHENPVAESAAASAPGVSRVDDEITVTP